MPVYTTIDFCANFLSKFIIGESQNHETAIAFVGILFVVWIVLMLDQGEPVGLVVGIIFFGLTFIGLYPEKSLYSQWETTTECISYMNGLPMDTDLEDKIQKFKNLFY